MEETITISIFDNKYINSCRKQEETWKKEYWLYYSRIFCCKDLTDKIRFSTVKKAIECIDSKITETEEEILKNVIPLKCCLPKLHEGRCQSNVNKIFTNKTIRNKLSWVFTTPGNDDYIFKNRCSRLFPIRFSDSYEKLLKNKNKKLKCAIPLKDASTPELIMSCYLDYLTLFLNVKGILKH